MNIQQRKALEKIVKNTITKKRDNFYDLKQEKINKLEKSIAEKNRKEATALFTKKKVLLKEIDKIGEKINELGFEINYDNELKPNLSKEQTKKIDNEFNQKAKDLDTVETKLIAKVWGVEGDFNDLMKDIEKELAKF